MNRDDISYALAKQLGSATAIESNYGRLDLDEELRCAVDAAIRQILERRLDEETGAATPGLGGPAGHLMREAAKYWKQANAKHHGAVQWISNDETGELLIYTRGEYRARLMQNIGACSDCDHDAVSVQLCLAAGLNEEQTSALLTRISGNPAIVSGTDTPYNLGWSAGWDAHARAHGDWFTQPSPTHGMNLGDRISHVGGRTNAQGYIEFGSVMAVDALVQHILRDTKTGKPSAGARDVLVERARQVSAEGWTPEHDDGHTGGEIAGAAACYAMVDILHWGRHYAIQMLWPWARAWWKPTDRRRNLVKAAALLMAEIERLDRDSERRKEEQA